MKINGDFAKFWAQPNHQQDFDNGLMRTSRPMQYALEQIQKADELYLPEIDFDTPFVRRIADCRRCPNDRP